MIVYDYENFYFDFPLPLLFGSDLSLDFTTPALY
jgi:hypothetical protein